MARTFKTIWEKGSILGRIDLIYVTVGTTKFDRLIKHMDSIAPNLGDEVIMQIANSEYTPLSTGWFRYAEYESAINYISEANLVVTHGGIGTILDCLNHANRLIVVPRQSVHNEAIDDHQFQIAEKLNRLYGISMITDLADLESAIKNDKEFNKHPPTESHLKDRLRDYLDSIAKEGRYGHSFDNPCEK